MFDVCAQNLLGNRNGSSARILQLHAQSMRCMQQWHPQHYSLPRSDSRRVYSSLHCHTSLKQAGIDNSLYSNLSSMSRVSININKGMEDNCNRSWWEKVMYAYYAVQLSAKLNWLYTSERHWLHNSHDLYDTLNNVNKSWKVSRFRDLKACMLIHVLTFYTALGL